MRQEGLVDEPLDGDITDVEYTTDDRLTDADYSSLLDMTSMLIND